MIINSFNFREKFFILLFILKILNNFLNWGLGIGDWGLGIGDWAQSPIPNPQSPFQKKIIYFKFKKK